MSTLLQRQTRTFPFTAKAIITPRRLTPPSRCQSAAIPDTPMNGESRGVAELLGDRLDIVRPRAMDALVIDSVCVARAVEYVRRHLCEVFGVEAVLRASGVPRRSLELAFHRALGCTPYQFITHARLARAKELLAATPSRKLSEIARACGFADLRRFRLVFRREFGLTPAEHRAALRVTRGDPRAAALMHA